MKKGIVTIVAAALVMLALPSIAAPQGGHGAPPAGHGGQHITAGAHRRPSAPHVGYRSGVRISPHAGFVIRTGFPRYGYWSPRYCDYRVGWYDPYTTYCRPYRPYSGAGFYISF